MASAGGNIKVVVRVRPFNSRELDRQAKCIVQMEGNQTVLVPPPSSDNRSKNAKALLDNQKTFAFDRSYWSFNKSDSHFAGQDNLFTDLGKPLLDNAFQGYNNCIFAYGQTGSGKSYSMMGYGAEYGVIPRICRNMFERIDEMHMDKNLKCTVEVSYLEIYNERVRDLLNPSTKGNLRVREHPSTGPYVEDLAKLAVCSFAEIESLMDEGNKARTVAATNMNETSSRSHAVFTLILTQKRHDVETNMDTEKVAKVSLVDLAGSERATSTGATGARLKEGAEINRSLSTLGRVIAALADLSSQKPGAKKSGKQVPYRDSVLTWLLKDSLGGNSLTAMIAAISPADINFEETLSTLRYADSAKRIKNHAVVNEDPNARMVRELKEELAQLRAKLSGGGATTMMEDCFPDTPLDQQMVSITQADGTIKKVSKAEIVDQLNQSEKLYEEINQTWEEKLQKTEQIQKEREAALEELGISIEKGFIGLSTPKKMPHLVNLSDDPLLAECLVYNLKPGTTTVGNVETSGSAEIRLNGSKVLTEHCTFENVDGVVTVVPKEGAAVMVNGQRIEQPKRLRSGFRIIIGDFHIFRFNHPQEARQERAEQGSLLRHTIIASQIGSPSPRPGHERTLSTISRADSEYDLESPSRALSPERKVGRDSEWSFARREAATALLGDNQKIATLTDDELDILFDDLQKVRAERKVKAQSRLLDGEEDSDSANSYPVREKYASTGTIDNFSLDTILTVPSTPQAGEEDNRLLLVREDMQMQLNKQKEDYQEKLKSAEEAHVAVEEIKAEKVLMEDSLRALKEDMEKQLQGQKEELQRLKEEHERELCQLSRPPLPPRVKTTGPTPRQLELARHAIERWQARRYVAMAEKVLQNAATLKEAQIMSQQMDKNIVFQFCVVDVGHTLVSSYDMVMSGIPGEDDEDLDLLPKPCIGVRVIDFKNSSIHLWSLQKLRRRLRAMRQVRQYVDSPQLLQHFNLENPFSESCENTYSRIGDVDVPLVAVFEMRVQDFTLDVVNPFTSNVVGIVRLSMEPSSAEAPSSTLKFNVVMRDFVGFPEREGTEVHAQLFVPGISEEGGATTTSLVKDFDEGPVRFESVHSMSLPFSSPRNAALRISIFAKVTAMHLDKLLSWDDMRDSAPRPKQKRQKTSRLPESEYYTEEKHDIFTRIQIQEISEYGQYTPVEVVQNGVLDAGAFQLHQGLQRRIVISLTHSSAKALQWKDVTGLRVGRVILLDHDGKASDLETPQPEIQLKLVSPATVKENADGTCNVTVICQWDSSAHGSPLLDRTTNEKYRVQVSLMWSVKCAKLSSPMRFSLDLSLQIRSRAYMRQTSLLQTFWNSSRVVHSAVGMFAVSVRPVSAKRAADLWRMDSKNDYVKGEETLNGWTPRGVSLVQDHISSRRQKRKVAEVETTKSVLGMRALTLPTTNGHTTNGTSSPDSPDYTDSQKALLHRILNLWTTKRGIEEAILAHSNITPPTKGAAFARTASYNHITITTNGTSSIHNTNDSPSTKPSLTASVRYIPKNPTLLKGGYLLTPSPNATHWQKRYVELRRPYLHIYSVPDGDEVNAINLTDARIDHDPAVGTLLKRGGGGGGAGGTGGGGDRGGNVTWAVFGRENSWLFKARGERDKVEWILKVDESYFSSGSGSSGEVSESDVGEVDAGAGGTNGYR
ncbi:kinesin-domain-containing protein [Tothia fuscella]|uniref:Kinesin-domain-containing protein n=1 Tax=Tothia fuscella TaxID=1048955 RepID=A0A9P4NVB4_9PEZI|nr:kinesin-domain-containing protein [Tothia fuscella]